MNDSDILGILSEYSDIAKVGAALPKVTLDTIAECRKYCETDDCGCYDKYCSCPPRVGSPESRLEKLAHYSKAAIVPITYEVDFRDKTAMDHCIKDLQDKCRAMMLRLQDKGLDCWGLADGGCKYCPRCAALDDEPCRFPQMQIQSVSGNGILMADYLKEVGAGSPYREGFIEMYAVILYN
jgi:predicted metal-binding protein